MSVIGSLPHKTAAGIGWLVFAGVNTVLTFVLPGEETIPYHLIWASFALFYGLWSWPKTLTLVVFLSITLVTGVALVGHAVSGTIGWEECAEIVLMGVILALLVWHVDRQRAAQARIVQMQLSERDQAAQRDLAARFGSHEVRTRLTIARGHAEMIADGTANQQTRADALVVIEELDKATDIATHILALVRAAKPAPTTVIDVDSLVDAVVRRWSVTVPRRWSSDVQVGEFPCDPERVETLLDCLLENAVKFTGTHDAIQVAAKANHAAMTVSVRDTGCGVAADELGQIFELFKTGRDAGARAGSGIGLAIVKASIESRGGSVTVESEPGQGTCFTLTFPRHPAEAPAPPLPDEPPALPQIRRSERVPAN